MKRLVALLVFVPIGIVVVALAVANRQDVILSVPPGTGDSALISLKLPLFVLLFATLFAGMLLGSFATWITQGRHRKNARRQQVEATKATFETRKQAEMSGAAGQSSASEQRALSALGLTAPPKTG